MVYRIDDQASSSLYSLNSSRWMVDGLEIPRDALLAALTTNHRPPVPFLTHKTPQLGMNRHNQTRHD